MSFTRLCTWCILGAVAMLIVALPQVAFAGQCEDIGMTLNESECFVVDDGDVHTIPMCSIEAASDIAPRIVHKTSDARIEAAKRCHTFEADDAASAPDEKKQREQHRSAQHADVPALPVLSATEALAVMQRLRDGESVRPGFVVGVYRPPQS